MQRTQSISIDPWNTYNIPWYFYHICNSSNSAPFFVSLIHIFLLGYHILPNVFRYNFLTRKVYWKFSSYFRSPIVSKSHPNFIHKETYFQCSPKIQTCLNHPIVLKVLVYKICINFWHRKILEKVDICPNLVAHVLSKEIGLCLRLLWSSTLCLYLKYIPNWCQYVNSFKSFITLLSMKSLIVFVTYN